MVPKKKYDKLGSSVKVRDDSNQIQDISTYLTFPVKKKRLERDLTSYLIFQGIQVIEHSGNHGGNQQTVIEETVVEEMEVPLPLNETEEIIQSPVNMSELLSSAVRTNFLFLNLIIDTKTGSPGLTR